MAKDAENLCPPPLEAQKGLDMLIEHLLGKDWYVALSMSQTQTNYEAVHTILQKYKKKKR